MSVFKFIPFAALLLFALPAHPYTFDTQGRAVSGLGYDDNVYDTASERKGDFLFRTILEGQTEISLPRELSCSGVFWNGAEFFTREESENRLRQKFSLGLSSRNPVLSGHLRGLLETSFFPWKDDYYYLKPGTVLALSRQFSPLFQGGLSAGYQYFSYHPDENLSYQFVSYSGFVQVRLIEGVRAEISGGESRRWYQSPALVLDANANLTPADFDRNDIVDEVTVALGYSPKPLVRAAYNFQKGTSNSYGLAFDNHRVSLAFSCPLPTRTLLHLFAVIQVKKYGDLGTYTIWAEDLRILLADEEDENLNSLNARVEHKLTGHLSLQLTYTRYSNDFSESRGYSKNIILFGIRFGS